jgi:hypothetical protein
MRINAVLGPIALALVASASPIEAGVQPATAGHQWPSPDGCLTNPAWDMMINSCNDGVTRLLVIPVQVDNTSVKHVFASMGGTTSSNHGTTCQAMAISFNNSAFSFSAKKTNFAYVLTMDLGFVGIPTHGALHFECNLTADSRLMNVEFQ